MSLSHTVATTTTPNIHPPLDVPNPSPNVKISDPDFEKLTAAEKLNDPDYRELIYQTYPNELTCACRPEVSFSSDISDIQKSSSSFLVCRSGCKGSCCSSVRQQGVTSFQQHNANKDDKVQPAPFMPTYCVGSSPGNVYDEDGNEGIYNGGYCSVENRLRGGGEGGEGRVEEGMYPQSGEVNRAMVRSFGDAWNGRNGCVVNWRREGGGGGGVGYEYMERFPVNMSSGFDTRTRCYNQENLRRGYQRTKHMEQPQDSHHDTNYLRASPNAYASDPSGPVAPGCCCPGKEMFARTTRPRGYGEDCVKKPCLSVDCLIKTFRETQEFVESLGKVQGLAGLGLMDPAESPYFGRDKVKDCNSEAIKSTTATSEIAYYPNQQCVGRCNQEVMKSIIGGPYPEATPFTIAVPGRGGVVREAVPSMPGPGVRYPAVKSRKGVDKEKLKDGDAGIALGDTETGPCREPRCKSKRRAENVHEALPSVDSSEDPMKKAHAKINGRKISRGMNKVKGGSKMRSGHRSTEPGPGGDRARDSKTSGKSGRRTMRFVYFVEDANSGFTCGHKHCVEERRRVPWNMGWLWNFNQTVGKQVKPRVGWKPGAIARHLGEILREAKTKFLLDHKATSKSRSVSSIHSKPRSAPSRGKRTKQQRTGRSVRRVSTKKDDEDKEDPEAPPTLYINRKDGTYYITMYPIKQETMDVPKLEEPMKPLQFKIPKNRDDASAATSSTASDMEIEFSPPAACNRYCKKPNVIHVDTQVKQQEITAAFKGDEGVKKEKKKEKKGKK